MKKLVNGNLVDLTQSEKDQKTLDEQNYTKELQDFETAKTNHTNNRTSGKAKLKTGEALTDAEVEALFG